MIFHVGLRMKRVTPTEGCEDKKGRWAGYKVHARWYLVPESISKMYPGSCFRGCGTVLHTWWTCSKVHRFLNEGRFLYFFSHDG